MNPLFIWQHKWNIFEIKSFSSVYSVFKFNGKLFWTVPFIRCCIEHDSMESRMVQWSKAMWMDLLNGLNLNHIKRSVCNRIRTIYANDPRLWSEWFSIIINLLIKINKSHYPYVLTLWTQMWNGDHNFKMPSVCFNSIPSPIWNEIIA